MIKPTKAALGVAILAAGYSSRMEGTHKLARKLAGKVLIQYVLDLCYDSALPEPIVILGARHDEVKAVLPPDTAVIINRRFHEGMGSSVASAVNAFQTRPHALLLLIADMPLIKPTTIKRLVSAIPSDGSAAIVVPAMQGQRGNPVIWTHHFFDALIGLKGDSGGRQCFNRFAAYIIDVDVDDGGIFIDIDDSADLERFAVR